MDAPKIIPEANAIYARAESAESRCKSLEAEIEAAKGRISFLERELAETMDVTEKGIAIANDLRRERDEARKASHTNYENGRADAVKVVRLNKQLEKAQFEIDHWREMAFQYSRKAATPNG